MVCYTFRKTRQNVKTSLVCLWACVMFFSLQIDRTNLTQAVSGTFLEDLKISTDGP
jgi:hypothetical protein